MLEDSYTYDVSIQHMVMNSYMELLLVTVCKHQIPLSLLWVYISTIVIRLIKHIQIMYVYYSCVEKGVEMYWYNMYV